MINVLLIIGICSLIGYGVYQTFKHKPGQDNLDNLNYDLETLVEFTKNDIADILSSEIKGISNEDYQRSENRKSELRKALRVCMLGSIKDKMYVKAHIKHSIQKVFKLDDSTVELIIPFSSEERLTVEEKFDILLFCFKRTFGRNAFNEIAKKHNLIRRVKLSTGGKGHKITKQDINEVYLKELEEGNLELSTEDKVDIIIQRVYQTYKGLGVVDELRDQNIDGLNGGTSGVPEDIVNAMEMDDYINDSDREHIPRAHEAVWMFFKGITVHLEFLSFGSQKELERICHIIYTYKSPGQLNESNGNKINEMADGSRVVALSPNLSDSWAFFVRKFDHNLVNIKEWFKDDLENGALDVIKWITYLHWGGMTHCYSGQQGTGKTTLMKASMANMYDLNIRIQEGSSYEMWARKAFPGRNILTFKEIPKVDGVEGMNIQKKTDGGVNFVGEVDSNKKFVQALNAAQVASLYTAFSHHAQTDRDLITAGTNAMLAEGLSDERSNAEEEVSKTIRFNIKLRNKQGHRYIPGISEYIPLERKPYPMDYRFTVDFMKFAEKAVDVFREFATRMTDRQTYTINTVIAYEDGKYVPKNKPSKETLMTIEDRLYEEDKQEFREFVERYWGEADASSN